MEYRLTQSLPVYFDLYSPPKRGRGSLPLLLALHGYAGNKGSMMRLARRIDEEKLLIASIQGPFQFIIPPANGSTQTKSGFCWRTQYKPEESIALHHQILLDCIELLAKEAQADRRRVFLLGFSQAVALNYRFIFSHPNLIRGAVGVCGGVPGDLQDGNYSASNTDLLHIATDADEYYPLAQSRTFKAKLADRAPSVELRVYKGGHTFPRRALPQIARWIHSRL